MCPSDSKMRAIGTKSTRPSGEFFLPNTGKFADPPFSAADLQELQVEKPCVAENSRDLLVHIKAAGVNPLDFKERSRGTPIQEYDAAGEVGDSGRLCQLGFKPGDKVWYMGSVIRPGCNSEFHLVDERLVSRMPKNWSFEQAAATPLCLLTAWECFEDKLGLRPVTSASKENFMQRILKQVGAMCSGTKSKPKKQKETVLISPGAGGLGSAAIQLAKQVFDLKVVATASREDTVQWCRDMGADVVISHRGVLKDQLQQHGISQVDYVLSGKIGTNVNLGGQYLEIIAPYGKIVSVDAPGVIGGLKNNFDFGPFFARGIQFLTHFVFTKPIYETKMESQGAILESARQLVEEGRLQPILKTQLPFSASGLQQAHRIMEEGAAIGKVVISTKM